MRRRWRDVVWRLRIGWRAAWYADRIEFEASEAQWLPFVNGAVDCHDAECLGEARRLALALHRIGWLLAPQRWVAPAIEGSE